MTIAISIPERAGLLPETEVEFIFDEGVVTIVKANSPSKLTRSDRVVAHLKGSGDVAMTTDEIMALTRDGKMPSIIVDSNVLLDLMTNDPNWFAWSASILSAAANSSRLVINPVL